MKKSHEVLGVKFEQVVICTVQGELAANIMKSHLESEGIPILLPYGSVVQVWGMTAHGLCQVRAPVR